MNFSKRLLLCVVIALSVRAAALSAQVLTVLHTFAAGAGITNADGMQPRADMVLSGNTFYGTAPLGGSNGFGVVFSMNTDGAGFTVLHAFTGADGVTPNKNLVLSGNTLYGTVGRGTNGIGNGSVFSMDTSGSNFSMLHTFTANTDGALGSPNGGLILDGDTLYGTAYQGGITNGGSIFSINTNGTFRLLHLFQSASDGENPLGTLVLSGGTLYGTARNGGSNGLFGTVFSIDTNGDNFTVLHTFSGAPSMDARNPDAGLILAGGTLYGTTVFGGTNGGGTVFSINTNGSGYAVLHSFPQAPGDGKLPEAPLLLRGDTLYGTTLGTGTTLSGTVFSLTTNGGNFTLLYTFSGVNSSFGNTNSSGAQPYGGLAMTGDVLYGTTSTGGTNGLGTIFGLVVEPTITGMNLTGPDLVLNGINAVAGNTYTLLASTNVALPLGQWSPLATNVAANNGSFIFTATNAVDASLPQRFYILQTQ